MLWESISENRIVDCMKNVQLACFVSQEDELFAALMALSSLQSTKVEIKPPIVLVEQPLLDEFHSSFPDFKYKPLVKKLGGRLETAFAKGYNWNLGFRPALTQLQKRLEPEDRLLYFSPNIVFFDHQFLKKCGDKSWAARQPDDFWPVRELYGPTLTQIWDVVVGLGGGKIDEWMDIEFPDEYWRRYPTASPHFFYSTEPQKFVEAYSEINDVLISDLPKELQGQGHAPKEATMTAAIVKTGGEIVDVEWDIDLMYFQDFYDLILRMNDDQVEWFTEHVLDSRVSRQLFKSVDEYKVIFYQGRLARLRGNLDSVERNFSILRMQQLIERRKVRKQIRKRLKAKENAQVL